MGNPTMTARSRNTAKVKDSRLGVGAVIFFFTALATALFLPATRIDTAYAMTSVIALFLLCAMIYAIIMFVTGFTNPRR